MDTKKKITSVAIMAAIAITASWNMSQSDNEVRLSDLALSNVEALAKDESPVGKVVCCPDKGDKCTLSSGDTLMDQDECSLS